MSWRWLDKRALLLLHDESLEQHGGAFGMRDENLLDSALRRPENLNAYGSVDFAELAAAYAVGIARNHPFIDGNKRAAFLALGLFLMLNGYRLHASSAEATMAMLAVASGEWQEHTLAAWVRHNVVPVN